jgi:phosphoglycerate dehydrogenase-like enzyme
MNDLNAEGEPCTTPAELRAWIAELHDVGTFDADTRDELAAEVPAVVFVLRLTAAVHGVDIDITNDIDAAELAIAYPTRAVAEIAAAEVIGYCREFYAAASVEVVAA